MDNIAIITDIVAVPTLAAYYDAAALQPYTEASLSAVLVLDSRVEQTEIRLSHTVLSTLNPRSGCRAR